MSSRAHLSSKTDLWPTPQAFYDRLDTEFGFVLDVCATPQNAKTDTYYALDHADPVRRDGLAGDWAADADQLGGAVWMNPPYGRHIAAWMAKARQAAQAGATVVTLVPVRADTRWWHEHVLASGAEVRFVAGRLTFGDAKHPATFASAVVIYRPTDKVGAPGPVKAMPAKAPAVVGTPTHGPAQTSAQVEAKIASFVPSSMTKERWALCADTVRDAVRALNPPTRATAQVYMSSLVAFLNLPCGWTGTAAPDLAVLLTPSNIAAATDALPPTLRRRNVRKDAMAAARALGITSRPPALNPNQVSACDPLMATAMTRPVPVALLLRSWEHATGKNALTTDPLRGATHQLKKLGLVTAGDNPIGTFVSASTVQVLAEAPDRKAAVTSNKRPSAPAPPKAVSPKKAKGKKLSARAALAHAKASYATTQAIRPAEGDVAPAPEVPASIQAAIEKFVPTPRNRTVWDSNREVAVRLVIGYEPTSVKNARNVCSNVATFLAWWVASPARTETGPVTFAEMRDPATLEAWMRLADRPAMSRATMRSVIRRAARSLNPEAAPAKVKYEKVRPPYSPEELTKWRHYAANQPTDASRARLSFIVGLCAGAGLDTTDLRHLRAEHIAPIYPNATEGSLGNPVLMVSVPSGTRSRTVPVRSVYAPLVRAALDLHTKLGKAPEDLVLGQVADRNNVVWNDARRAHTADGTEALIVSRLRNSWLVAVMCAPVSLADLLRASGLYSARTITDLLPHCPAPDTNAIAELLADLTEDKEPDAIRGEASQRGGQR